MYIKPPHPSPYQGSKRKIAEQILNRCDLSGIDCVIEPFAGTVKELTLPLAHLDRVDGVVGGDFLDRLAATDRLHGDPGFELGAVGAAFAHRWEPLSGAVPRLRG